MIDREKLIATLREWGVSWEYQVPMADAILRLNEPVDLLGAAERVKEASGEQC